jgi:hypothetical protein
MGIMWLEKQDLVPAVLEELAEADIVLDVGCGIRPQNYVEPLVHICCEPCEQYVDLLRNQLTKQSDGKHVVLKASWADAVRIFPAKSVDSVFLIDVIEHLEKGEASELLKATENLVRRQIVIFTPLGFMPQHHSDGKDAWGLEGGTWQEHKSGWIPEDFDDSWEIYASKAFHVADNMGKKLRTPHGAFWAVKTFADIRSRDSIGIDKKMSIRVLVDRLGELNRYEMRTLVLISRVYRRLKRIFAK